MDSENPIITLSKTDMLWCEEVIAKISSKKPRSRKQSKLSEYQTSMEGARAELAVAYFLCEDIEAYKKLAMETKSNRGRDLTTDITGFKKPVEVKFTPVKTEKTGYLFLRPPVGVGQVFDRHKHIDDSYFFLTFSSREDLKHFEMLGWIDGTSLCNLGKYNPVPRRAGMLETFGIHWTGLFSSDTINRLDS